MTMEAVVVSMIIKEFVRSYDKQDVQQEVTVNPETFKMGAHEALRKNSVEFFLQGPWCIL